MHNRYTQTSTAFPVRPHLIDGKRMNDRRVIVGDDPVTLRN